MKYMLNKLQTSYVIFVNLRKKEGSEHCPEPRPLRSEVLVTCSVRSVTGAKHIRHFLINSFQLTRSMRSVTFIFPVRVGLFVTFQLTRSMRSVTITKLLYCHTVYNISTHTLHAERDLHHTTAILTNLNFNSHAPCGA